MTAPCIQRSGSVWGAQNTFQTLYTFPEERVPNLFILLISQMGKQKHRSEETCPLSAVVRHQSKQS